MSFFKPASGFIIRPKESQGSAGYCRLVKLALKPGSREKPLPGLESLSQYVEEQETAGCHTYVILEDLAEENEVSLVRALQGQRLL